MNPLTQSKNRTILSVLVALALSCFALSPPTRAACRQGCDNGNTFLGDSALVSNATGSSNVAIGSYTLASNTTGYDNTAVGFDALDNSTSNYNTAVGFFAL